MLFKKKKPCSLILLVSTSVLVTTSIFSMKRKRHESDLGKLLADAQKEIDKHPEGYPDSLKEIDKKLERLCGIPTCRTFNPFTDFSFDGWEEEFIQQLPTKKKARTRLPKRKPPVVSAAILPKLVPTPTSSRNVASKQLSTNDWAGVLTGQYLLNLYKLAHQCQQNQDKKFYKNNLYALSSSTLNSKLRSKFLQCVNEIEKKPVITSNRDSFLRNKENYINHWIMDMENRGIQRHICEQRYKHYLHRDI